MRGRYYIATLGAVNPVTATPAFRRWFGASKVVDAHGHPKVVYHGTPDLNFDAFRHGLVFFSDNPSIASQYGENAYGRGEQGGVLPVYLWIEAPLMLDGHGKRYSRLTLDDVHEQQRDAVAERWGMREYLSVRRIAEIARILGHDGVIARNVEDSLGYVAPTPSTIYVTFNPQQVKSASGNVGTFDPRDPSILRGIRRRRR